MGTSEEIRAEQQQQRQQRLQAPYPQHALSPLMAPAPQGPGFHNHNQSNGGSWPHEKLSESDVAHAAHAMDIDPTSDANTNQREPMSPSPTNHYTNGAVFHFGDPANNNQQPPTTPGQQQQSNFHGDVAIPVKRFLIKQTFGFIPKPSFPSPSDGVPPRSAPSSPLPSVSSPLPSASAPLPSAAAKIPSLRLPSLSSPAPSPLGSPQSAFAQPVGDALSRLFDSASLGNSSAPSSPLPTPTRSSSHAEFVLPPLKRACLSPTTTTLPPLAQQLSLEDIGKPFRYQRSMSCPSDAMARAAAASAASEAAYQLPPPPSSYQHNDHHSQQPSYHHHHHHSHRHNHHHQGDSESEYDAYAAPHARLQRADVPKHRVERSNSLDVTAVLAMREAHHRALHGGGEPSRHEGSPVDFRGWLDRSSPDRHPLASLAESAHAMQRLEQSRSSNQESPRSITSDNVSGDESMNPFDVSDSSDARREKKLCAFPRCSSNAVTRGLCISHGGGRRCQRKGCTRGAQSKGLCVAHGGGRICKAKGCSNIQRSMGLCIRHGGGKRCSVPGCQKGVVRQDLCTAHGGKRKCKVEDCNKHVKKKGLCRSHANSVLGASAVASPRGGMSPEYSS